MSLEVTALRGIHMGEACFVLGNGPSLDLLDGIPDYKMRWSIGMNRSWHKVISPYFCIVRNNNHLEDMLQKNWDWSDTTTFYLGPQNKMFQGMPKETILTCGGHINTSRFTFINITENRDLDFTKGHKVYNTGVFSLYVAIWLGFRRIFLLGYDCEGKQGHFKTGATTGRWAHDKEVDRSVMGGWFNKEWGPRLAEECAKERISLEIFNCNPTSWINYWPHMKLEQALEEAWKSY